MSVKQTNQRNFEVPDEIRVEWHPELGPPFTKDWQPTTKNKELVTPSDSWCCPCCPDEDNDIMWKDRLQTNPNFSRGKRDYDAFYGAPIIQGKYSHNFEGRKPQRPAGIRMMGEQQQQGGGVGGFGGAMLMNPNQLLLQHQHQHQQVQQQPSGAFSSAGGGGGGVGTNDEQEMRMLSPNALSGGGQQQQGLAQVNSLNNQTTGTVPPSAVAEGGAGGNAGNSNNNNNANNKISTEPMVTPNTESKQQNQIQQQTEQQKQMVIGFAKYIGINPDTEPHLLGLAQQCLAAPPPAPWQSVRDPNSGRTYFANAQTKQTSWDHPLVDTFRERVVQWRQHYLASQQQQQQKQQEGVNPLSKQAAGNEQQLEGEEETKPPVSDDEKSNNEDDSDKSSDPHRVPSPQKDQS